MDEPPPQARCGHSARARPVLRSGSRQVDLVVCLHAQQGLPIRNDHFAVLGGGKTLHGLNLAKLQNHRGESLRQDLLSISRRLRLDQHAFGLELFLLDDKGHPLRVLLGFRRSARFRILRCSTPAASLASLITTRNATSL